MRLLCLVLASLLPLAAQAGPTAHHLVIENDGLFFDDDRYYTSGLQWTALRPPDQRPAWAPAGWGNAAMEQWSIGQLIYTPADIAKPGPQPFDHPYAGLLYGEKQWLFLSEARDSMTHVSLRVGVTGPPSLAEQAQTFLHRVIGVQKPMGWQYQIPARLGVMGTLERRVAVPALAWDVGGNVQTRVAATAKLAAGNLQTFAGAGLMLALGKNLPPLLPAPPGIQNAALPADGACLWESLRCLAYVGAEWRYIRRNVFVEAPRIQLEHHVRDAYAGLRLSWPASRWFVQAQLTWRSPEFRSCRPVHAHRWGALTLGTEW